MTFIDAQTKSPDLFQIIVYSIMASIFVICGIWAFYRSHTRRHYHRVYVVRFLFPIACLFCSTENAFLASSDYFIKDSNESLSLHPMLKVLFVLQAMQVPIYLVTIFELTYLIHKRRSVHFLGMYFDEGRLGKRVKGVFSTPCKSFLARNFIRILSTLLFVIGITVNFEVLPGLVTVGDLAGKTGWWNLFKNKGNLKEELDVIMSLFPTAILIFCSFVLCTTLWMYGTNTSMIVHSSFINPWFAPFFGTIVLTIGQFFTIGWFAISSNAGFLVYTVTLILLMKQIDRDIVSFAEFTDFLHQVAKKGNEISVHNVITSKLDGSGHGVAIAPSFTSSGLRLGPSNTSAGVGASSGAGGIGLPDLEEQKGNGNNVIL